MMDKIFCGLAVLVLFPAICEFIKLANATNKHRDRNHIIRCFNLTKRKN